MITYRQALELGEMMRRNHCQHIEYRPSGTSDTFYPGCDEELPPHVCVWTDYEMLNNYLLSDMRDWLIPMYDLEIVMPFDAEQMALIWILEEGGAR